MSAPAPFVRRSGEPVLPHDPRAPLCDVCTSANVVWIKCKLVCRNCRSIVMSCADI